MKRAWPYAVALAIVVTGCYLALTPLLRSLSPSATTSSSSLQQQATSATVGQSKVIIFHGSNGGKTTFASALPQTVKKAKNKATAPTDTTPQSPTATTGFASGASSTQAPPKTAVKAKTKPVKKGGGSVNGSVDTGNGGGLASPGSNAPVNGGTHSDPAGN